MRAPAHAEWYPTASPTGSVSHHVTTSSTGVPHVGQQRMQVHLRTTGRGRVRRHGAEEVEVTSEPRARPSRLWFSVHRTVAASGGMGATVVALRLRRSYLDGQARAASPFSRRWQRRVLDVVRLGGIPQTDPFRVPGRPDVRMVPSDSYITNHLFWLGLDSYEAGEPVVVGHARRAHTERRSSSGANIGLYTVARRCICGDGRPYTAVEPNPVSCAALRRNLDAERARPCERRRGGGRRRLASRRPSHSGSRTETSTALSAGAFVDGAVDLDAAAGSVGDGACAYAATDLVDGVDLHQARHRRARGRGAVRRSARGSRPRRPRSWSRCRDERRISSA